MDVLRLTSHTCVATGPKGISSWRVGILSASLELYSSPWSGPLTCLAETLNQNSRMGCWLHSNYHQPRNLNSHTKSVIITYEHPSPKAAKPHCCSVTRNGSEKSNQRHLEQGFGCNEAQYVRNLKSQRPDCWHLLPAINAQHTQSATSFSVITR